MKQESITLRQVLDKKLRDPEFRKYYDEEGRKLELGLKITKLRNHLGMSQAVLAKKMKTSQATVARLESGDYVGFSLKTLQKIAWATKADLHIDFQLKKAS
jgi:ribosome-binding protein aMBF1 (putative translation factor)